MSILDYDVQEIRRVAAQLRVRAVSLSHLESSLRGRVEGMTFQGPAGDAFREEAERHRKTMSRAADDLESFARFLDAQAGAIEVEQALERKLKSAAEELRRK